MSQDLSFGFNSTRSTEIRKGVEGISLEPGEPGKNPFSCSDAVKTCPTCSQVTDKHTSDVVQARLATRPFTSPGQVRHITKLESELKVANAWINAKCTIAGCWKSKYKELVEELEERKIDVR